MFEGNSFNLGISMDWVFTSGRSCNIRCPVGCDIMPLCMDWSAMDPDTSASVATMSCRSGLRYACVAE